MKRSFRNSLSATLVALCGTSTLVALSAPVASAAMAATGSIALSVTSLTAGYQGPLTVSVTGTGTNFVQGGTVAYILAGSTNLQDATNFQVTDSTHMSFSLAGGLTAGTYTVEVQTPPVGTNTQPETETAQVTANPGPSISSVSFGGTRNASYLGAGYPNTTVTVQTANATLSAQTQVLIESSDGNVKSGAISGVQTDSTNGSVSFTLVGGTSGLAAGNYVIDVKTGGQDLTSNFTVRSPQLAGSSINVPLPSSASQVVTLTAVNGRFTAAGLKVTVGGKTYTNVTAVNDNELQFTIGQGDFATAGAQDITVTDNAESITQSGYINFVSSSTPTASVSPASVPGSNTSASLTVSTTGLQASSSTVTVTNASGQAVAGVTSTPGLSSDTVTLPAGLTPGTYTVTVTDNSQVPARTATATFVVSAVTPTAISTTPATLPSGTPGQEYPGVTLRTNGSGTYTYSILSGTLPTGLSLGEDGRITGTLGPAAKTSTVTVQALGTAGSVTTNLTISVGSGQTTSPSPVPSPSPTPGSGSSAGSAGGSTGSTAGSSAGTGAFTTPVASESVGTSGLTFSKPVGNGKVTIDIPAGAFQTPETVSVTTADVSTLKVTPPVGGQVVTAIGVNFSAAAPGVPITLTIENAGIPDGALVYKVLPDGSLKQVQAAVTAGKAVISFDTDPNFVVVAPAVLKKGQRIISFGGQNAIVPGIVRNNTTYMPIWYVMHFLESVGIKSKWDGHSWQMTTTSPVDLTSVQAGKGAMRMYFNGHLVQYVDGFAATDPSTGKNTTYMPIWYVMQVLKRLNVVSTWDGTTWKLVKK